MDILHSVTDGPISVTSTPTLQQKSFLLFRDNWRNWVYILLTVLPSSGFTSLTKKEDECKRLDVSNKD